jgi:hypothetical protein
MSELLCHLFRNFDLDVFVKPPTVVAEQENVRSEQRTRTRFVSKGASKGSY